MKIDSAQSSLPIAKATPKSAKTSAETVNKDTRSYASNSAVQARITQWFAKVSISSSLELNDSRQKANLVERRRRLKEEHKAQNLRAILESALQVAISDLSDEDLDPDWFFAFTELAENIYSPSMQELWSKIFAVEVSRPGSFSLRSLETLRRLTQRDSKLFSTACRLASRRHGDAVPRIILNYHQRRTITRWFSPSSGPQVNLAEHGLSYPSVLALIDLGLIVATEIESAEFPMNSSVAFRCGEKSFNLHARHKGVALAYYKFSSVGAELFKLAKRHEHSGYLESLQHTLAPAFRMSF